MKDLRGFSTIWVENQLSPSIRLLGERALGNREGEGGGVGWGFFRTDLPSCKEGFSDIMCNQTLPYSDI
jgi:hypothetical protein